MDLETGNLKLVSHRDESGTVKLITKCKKEFVVPLEIANMSELVKRMMVQNGGNTSKVPLVSVDEEAIEKVVGFCEHYLVKPFGEIQKPLMTLKMEEVVPEWYAEFADVDLDLLYKIIMAAHYMEIPPLLDLMCAKLGMLLKIDKVPAHVIRATMFEPESTSSSATPSQRSPCSTPSVPKHSSSASVPKHSSSPSVPSQRSVASVATYMGKAHKSPVNLLLFLAVVFIYGYSMLN